MERPREGSRSHCEGGHCAACGSVRLLSSHLFHVTVFVFTLVTVVGRVRLSLQPHLPRSPVQQQAVLGQKTVTLAGPLSPSHGQA